MMYIMHRVHHKRHVLLTESVDDVIGMTLQLKVDQPDFEILIRRLVGQ